MLKVAFSVAMLMIPGKTLMLDVKIAEVTKCIITLTLTPLMSTKKQVRTLLVVQFTMKVLQQPKPILRYRMWP